MFEEVVEPYIGEIQKYRQRELPHIVKEYCIGIIDGLVNYNEEPDTEFWEWIQDSRLIILNAL